MARIKCPQCGFCPDDLMICKMCDRVPELTRERFEALAETMCFPGTPKPGPLRGEMTLTKGRKGGKVNSGAVSDRATKTEPEQ